MLAPLAFFAAATVLVLLVHGALTAEQAGSGASATTTARSATADRTARGTETKRQGKRRAGKRFYRVRSGDTLESIAARSDTTVDDLLALNPDIDPLTLRTGQRIRVR